MHNEEYSNSTIDRSLENNTTREGRAAVSDFTLTQKNEIVGRNWTTQEYASVRERPYARRRGTFQKEAASLVEKRKGLEFFSFLPTKNLQSSCSISCLFSVVKSRILGVHISTLSK